MQLELRALDLVRLEFRLLNALPDELAQRALRPVEGGGALGQLLQLSVLEPDELVPLTLLVLREGEVVLLEEAQVVRIIELLF